MQACKADIFNELQKTLYELFELEIAKTRLDSHLYEELDLDSIDAVDLLAHLQTMTQVKFQPEEFKAVKTVSDVVDVIYNKLQNKQ